MNRYDPKKIRVPPFLEHLRSRPTMYVGWTDANGLHSMACEVINNTAEQAQAGRATCLHVSLRTDGSILLADNGPGIPVGAKCDPSTLQVILTRVGGCECGREAGHYRRVGLFGIGLAPVNGLSAWLDVTIRRGGRIWRQRYERGVPVTRLLDRGPTPASGTRIEFLPDSEIFGDAEFDAERLRTRLRNLAFLLPGLRTALRDHRRGERVEFYEPDGIVRRLSGLKSPLLPAPIHGRGVVVTREDGEVEIEWAATWQEVGGESEPTFLSFANLTATPRHGAHVEGVLAGLQRAFPWPAPRSLGWQRGLVAVISVTLAEPQFEGATRHRLGNRSLAPAIRDFVERTAREWARTHPRTAQLLLTARGEGRA